MTNRVLISGCSFSDPDYKSLQDNSLTYAFPIWPEIFCDRVGWTIIENVSVSGTDNVTLINKAAERLLCDADKFDIALVALSQMTRASLPGIGSINFNLLNPAHNDWDLAWWEEQPTVKYFSSIDYYNLNMLRFIDPVFQAIHRLISICKLLGKRLLMFDLIGTAEFHTLSSRQTRNLALGIKEHRLFEEIFNSQSPDIELVGFPFCNPLYGQCALDEMQWHHHDEYHLSKKDSHPGKLGHEMIARWLKMNV